MTVQISSRGKECFGDSTDFALRTMTGATIAGQLKAVADDYQQRAEKASHDGAARTFAR
jgi:hypothetical protein